MNTLKIRRIAICLIAAGLAFSVTGVHAQKSHDAHGSMQHQAPAKTFEHAETVDGVRTEFQVMSLEAMNMTDPGGATHHVMVRFVAQNTDQPISDVVGKVKMIAPDGAEQVETLENYSGVFAANFTVEQPGNYGVICLFMTNGKKHVVKFWYPHGA